MSNILTTNNLKNNKILDKGWEMSDEGSIMGLLEFSILLKSPRIYQFYLNRLYTIHQQDEADLDKIAYLESMLLYFIPKGVSTLPILRLRLYHLAKNGLGDQDIYTSMSAFPKPTTLGERQYRTLAILNSISQELNSSKLKTLIEEWKSVSGKTAQEFKAILPKLRACIQEAANLLQVCEDERLMALPEAKVTMRCD